MEENTTKLDYSTVFTFQFAMDAINSYLIEEVETAYKKVEVMKTEADLRTSYITVLEVRNNRQRHRIVAQELEIEAMRERIAEVEGDLQRMTNYAEFVEERVLVAPKRRVPKKVLRTAFETGQTRYVLINRVDIKNRYFSRDLINWHSYIDLTEDSD